MEIKEMQEEAYKIIEEYNKKHNLNHNKDTIFLHLVEEVGELAKEMNHEKSNWRADFNREKFEHELIDVLYQILILAKDYDVNLEEVFKRKIKIFRERFGLKNA